MGSLPGTLCKRSTGSFILLSSFATNLLISGMTSQILGAQVSFLPCMWIQKVVSQQVKMMWPRKMALCDLGCSGKTGCCSKRQIQLQCAILEMFFKDALQQVSTASCNMTKEFLAMARHIIHHQDKILIILFMTKQFLRCYLNSRVNICQSSLLAISAFIPPQSS